MRHAVILAGGGGTRLWPASRRRRPKQLLPLGARPDESLLRATVRRIAPLCPPERTWIVTAADQAEACRAELPELPPGHVVAEPAARNTAPAIGLAAVAVLAADPEATLAVLPADHVITDEPAFRAAVAAALAVAERERALVTIGVRPTRPETGYGYLEVGEPAPGPEGARQVVRFVEKPARDVAEGYLAAGRFLWNGGMFFFPARRYLEELARHLPPAGEALAAIAAAPDRAAEAAARYPRVPSISVDYAVMEKAAGILTVPGDFGWNDVGSFAALADVRPADDAGNVTQGLTVLHDARDNIVVSDAGPVALVGVSGLVVVRAGDAVLVLPRERAQDVREIVRQLEERKLDAYL